MLIVLRFLVLFFLLVVVPRVSDYATRFSNVEVFGLNVSGFVAFAFAIGLSATVFLATYASSLATNRLRELEAGGVYSIPRKEMNSLKRKKSRTAAEERKLKQNSEYERVYSAATAGRIAAVAFATIEGIFNVAEVFSNAIDAGTLTSPWGPFSLDLFSSWVFAAFPTIASVLLAYVIAQFDRAGSFLDLSMDGIFSEATGTKKGKETQPKPTFKEFFENLPEIEEGVVKDPEIDSLRKKELSSLGNKEQFEATMYNRKLDQLNTEIAASAFGVSRRQMQRWIKDLKLRRENAKKAVN